MQFLYSLFLLFLITLQALTKPSMSSYEMLQNDEYLTCHHRPLVCPENQVCAEHRCACSHDQIMAYLKEFGLAQDDPRFQNMYCICTGCIPLSPRAGQENEVDGNGLRRFRL